MPPPPAGESATPLRPPRGFADADDGPGAAAAAVVSEELPSSSLPTQMWPFLIWPHTVQRLPLSGAPDAASAAAFACPRWIRWKRLRIDAVDRPGRCSAICCHFGPISPCSRRIVRSSSGCQVCMFSCAPPGGILARRVVVLRKFLGGALGQ